MQKNICKITAEKTIFLVIIIIMPVINVKTLNAQQKYQSNIFQYNTSIISLTYHSNFTSNTSSEISSPISSSLSGTLGSHLFYAMTIGLSLDRLNPEVFPPYTFTKQSDGFHFWLGDDKYSNGINDHLNFGFSIAPEITAKLLDDRLEIRWAKVRRNWGIGEGSLLLGQSARPFDGIDITADLAPGVKFMYVTGSLGDWREKQSEQKMLTAHKIRFSPFPWLDFAVGEAVVWGKRLELSYLNPLMSYFLAQNISTGDMDNIAYIGDLEISPLPYVSWYFSFFLDEIEIGHISDFFQFPKNQYAFYTGIRIPLDSKEIGLKINGGELLLQYTKLEPYVYTHYPQPYPFFDSDVKVNIAFTHDGENLGYPLPPNSDEFLVKLLARPRTDLALTGKYRYIRHGTGNHADGQIEGDIGTWLDYGHLKEYPDKNFLHDGIYELIHVVTVSGSWTPAFLPLELTAEYSFVLGTNYGNISGNTVVKNLIAVGASYSF